ncbi:Stabilin-2 [Exaiptasia diaphana]|nr:Stabilin-2 [Exaiptasia diaphana]
MCTPNPTDPFLASCSCKKGYEGDGQFCSAIDLCQANNGGCHENATCANIGPGKRNCFCNDGYHGDGITCIPDNPCTVDNGGCSLRATCERTGPGQRKCTCGAKYYGDGVTCIGSSMEVLKSDPELTQMNDLIKKYGIDKLLKSNYMANVLAPTNRALKKILSDRRRKRRSGVLTPTVEQYLRYHIIGCVRFNKNSFKTGENFTSLLGAPIWMTLVSQGNKSRAIFKDYKGNSANITQALESGNGFVFKLDSLLTPPAAHLEVGDPSKSVIKVANELGHTTSVSLLKRVGLENIVSSPYGRPYLVFLPTNHGIDKLPDDFKARLLDPANAGELTEYIKYHVVQNVPENLTTDYFVRSGGGVQFTTLQGQSIFISCKGDKGDLYVNGISRISKRDIHFKGGVAFVVDDIITPLGLGGKCDEVVHEKITGRCSSCLSPEGCPHESTLVGTTNYNCSYDNGFLGCQHICMKRKIHRKCCPNFYGSDCRACPGGLGMTCSRRGQCDDGLTGSGRCSCREDGTAACTCWESYIGNGYVCNGNILQTLQNTVKVQNFYKALYHLGNTNQGQSLFSSLQIDSNYVTVFAPINSALRIKDLNITLAKNFIISGRIVLSTINDVYTATNLLGTKIMIRKLFFGILTINGVAHVLGDMKATNGLIYIVDQVIPPGVLGRHGKDKGVSGGAVAGIVITVLILIAIIAGVIWFLRKRALLPNSAFRYKKENDTVQYDSDVFQENPPSLSYNNPMYDVSEPGPDRIEVHGDKSLPPPFTEHTDFTNPIYELEERPPEEFFLGASGMQLLFQDDEKPPGEEICSVLHLSFNYFFLNSICF